FLVDDSDQELHGASLKGGAPRHRGGGGPGPSASCPQRAIFGEVTRARGRVTSARAAARVHDPCSAESFSERSVAPLIGGGRSRFFRRDRRACRVPKFVVQGGRPLKGRIRPAGNKNAALPMVAATLLTDEPVVLENVPDIRDVRTLLDLMMGLGVEVEWTARNTVRIHARELKRGQLNSAAAAKIRAS